MGRIYHNEINLIPRNGRESAGNLEFKFDEK